MALHRSPERFESNIVQTTQHVAARRIALCRRVMIRRVVMEARHELGEALGRRKVGDRLQDVLLSANQLVRLGEEGRAARLDEHTRRLRE